MGLSVGLGTVTQVPAGIVSAFAGVNAPSGWLMCYGQAVSRTDYSALFAALSTTYGSGDGSTTFNIPDMRGRAVAGVDNMGGTAASRLTSTVLTASNTLGATGGTQTHTLAASEIATHSHTNTLSSNTVASDGHTHSARGNLAAAVGASGGDATAIAYEASTVVSGGPANATSYTVIGASFTSASRAFNHYTPVYGSTAANTGSTTVSITNANSTGGGNAHANTQPTLVLNYIIKATQ